MVRLLPFIIYVVLVAYSLADMLQRPEDSPYSLPKWAWVLIILLFPYIGAAAWLFLKFTNRNSGPSQREQRGMGPDDDPDYLMWLREQERRRKLQGDK
jgi:uncharacterized SAM-binding protein YcdF (DUF218 family)